MFGFNPSLYNLSASLDLEKEEGGMLRTVVSKLEHLQAAFGGFSVPEEVPFFPQELPEEWRSATDPAAMPEPENPLVLDPVATALNFISKSLYVLKINFIVILLFNQF
ncbi:hypothetical protein K1719_038800 [Acacia pycnantha]|nr:hypothetical protein K1719_038800 [Acacia pycnantha]